MTETPQHERVNTEHLRDYTQLRRSVTDRKVAGVAGGLGRHLNVDPTILRVAFVVLCFFGGAGFVLYGAAWLLVPEEGQDQASVATSAGARNGLLIAAAVLAGLLLVGDSWGGFWFPWPLAVIAVVLFLVLMNRDKPVNTDSPPGPWSGNQPGPVGTSTYPAAGGTDPAADAPVPPAFDPTGEYPPQPPVPPWMPPTQQAYQPPPPAPDRGPKLFWVTLALVAIALGTLGLYDVSGGSVVAAAYPALGLTVVGGMLVVGAWVGRAGGLILLGILAAIALTITSAVNTDFDEDRRIDVAPTSAAQVADSYSVGAGRIHLDLSRVHDIAALDGRTIDLEANAGEIVVIVPDGMDVDVQADVAVAGEAALFGRVTGGPSIHTQGSISGGTAAPDLQLDVQLLVGSIEVRQS